MKKIMTPSVPTERMTIGQINKAVANYEAMLKKHASDFPVEIVQRVLGMSELEKKQFELFRSFIEAQSKTVFRCATVNRNRSQSDAIGATGRALYLDKSVVKTMPMASGNIEAIFVNLGRNVDSCRLDDELARLGFELIVDPQGLAALNEADSAFADDHPNATQWKDISGKYCYMFFDRCHDERFVQVAQKSCFWQGVCWFPCRRKLAL